MLSSSDFRGCLLLYTTCHIYNIGEEADVPLQVFISYHWDNQEEVLLLRSSLDRAGISCWMDVGQMGGGDRLYAEIYKGIHSCQVL